MCTHCGCQQETHTHDDHHHDHHHSHDPQSLSIEERILAVNDQFASKNRDFFKTKNILALNLVSSPGAGKTTLLVKTLHHLKSKKIMAVIEGDQQTQLDADRIAATGVPVHQVNTGKGCHLDAHQVQHAMDDLKLKDYSLLFIENVGNLVCPALFDLGESRRVVVLSVTEGSEKPIKYPYIFANADLMIINKIDLLPYVDFNVETCVSYARQINPAIQVITLSSTTGENFEEWVEYLEG